MLLLGLRVHYRPEKLCYLNTYWEFEEHALEAD